ncbi:MAG: 50S ribosomal protein L21e [Halobacteria archaeon]
MPNSKGERNDTRNKLKNDPRDKGISPPSQAVKDFDDGENVHIDIDPSTPDGRPNPRFHGKTGKIAGTQGAGFVVEFDDGEKTKTVVVRPQHLESQS